MNAGELAGIAGAGVTMTRLDMRHLDRLDDDRRARIQGGHRAADETRRTAPPQRDPSGPARLDIDVVVRRGGEVDVDGDRMKTATASRPKLSQTVPITSPRAAADGSCSRFPAYIR